MMFEPEDMSKISILAPKSRARAVIELLYSRKVLHVETHRKDALDIGEPLAEAERISGLLVRTRAVMSYLSLHNGFPPEIPAELKNGKSRLSLEKVEHLVSKLQGGLKQESEKLKQHEEEKKRLLAQKEALTMLSELKVEPEVARDTEALLAYIGTVSKTEGLEEELARAAKNFEFASEGNTIALFVDRRNGNVVQILNAYGFKAAGKVDDTSGSAEDALKDLEIRLGRLEKEIMASHRFFENTAALHKNVLLALEHILKTELKKQEAPLWFGATEQAFIITGFLPTAGVNEITREVNEAADNRVLVEQVKIGHKDKVPVKLRNFKGVRPFEFFLELYTLPRYKEFDPTAITFITFPLLFGFMLGDVGYGFVTLLIAFMLKRLKPQLGRFMNIMMFAAIATMIFGFLFGEVFGEEIIHLGNFIPVISREHQISEFLILTLITGIIHLNIGLLIGFWNVYRHHGLSHAIFGKASWIVLQISVALLGASMAGKLAIPAAAGWAGLLLAVAMLVKGEGVRGIIELPSIFTNIFSYSRIMALGLASISLAVVINEIAAGMFHSGIGGIIAGTIIIFIGHAINLALGLLGPFLHSLRLHYVEFYSKFYQGGGSPYKPFGTE